MRPQFFLVMLVVTTGLIGTVFYLKPGAGKAPATVAGAQTVAPAPARPENRPAQTHRGYVPIASLVTDSEPLTPDPAVIEAEIAHLQKLSLSDDPAALTPILAALASPEREIRDAAVEAAREFGSAEAIPALKAAADQTQDLEEKIALLEAADFLSLPEMTLESQPVVRTPEELQAEALRHAQRRSPH